MKKSLSIPMLVSTLLLSSLLISGCTEKQSDEAMIQVQIKALQTAIENHDRGDFMALIDTHYQDQLNNDRRSLQRMLMAFFFRYKDISVYVSATQIELQSVRADAHSQVVVTGGKNLIPDSARHYQVQSCWKKVSDEWLLSCLQWQ